MATVPAWNDLIKKEFHHLDTIYFNTAYFGPSPYSAKQKVSRALQKELDPSFHEYSNWIGIPERIRSLISDVTGLPVDNITHSTSTSDVINTIAHGYKFKEGDHVASINKDYPSNVLPWMVCQKRRGITFDLHDLGDEVVPTSKWLEKKLHPNTRIFDISHVTFDTGKRMDLVDLGKFCQERGILFIVDATQALGGMEITAKELKYIDVLSCSSYKWMLGPYGHAFAYFSDRALELVEHTTGNWIVSPNSKVVYNLLDYTDETLPGARKYDRGQSPNMLVNACFEASLELLKELTLTKVQAANQELRDYFLENYPTKKFDLITPKDHMGNIVCIKGKSINPVDLERELKYRNVDVSVRQGNVRLSFHLFNTKEQVEELIKALDI